MNTPDPSRYFSQAHKDIEAMRESIDDAQSSLNAAAKALDSNVSLSPERSDVDERGSMAEHEDENTPGGDAPAINNGYDEIPLLTDRIDIDEVAPVETPEREIASQIEQLPEEQRFSVGAALETIRYDVARGVSETASYVFSGVGERLNGGATGRFFKAIGDVYAERAEENSTQLKELVETRKSGSQAGIRYQDIANVGSITANALRYGRILADAAGYTASAPLRWVTLGATLTKEAADITKEARFTYDEVKEKTRVRDIEDAEREAWAIYERALKNKGIDSLDAANGMGVSSKEILDAYREEMPKDILRRLSEEPVPGTGTKIIEGMYRRYMAWRAEGIERKIIEIEKGEESSDMKAIRKRELLLRFGRSKVLNDFDRMLSQQGPIDRIAMNADIGAKISGAVVYGVMGQSITILFDRIFDAFSERGSEMVPAGPISTSIHKEMIDAVVEQTAENDVPEADLPGPTLEHVSSPIEYIPLSKHPVEFGDSMYKVLREHVPAFRNLGPGQAQEYAMTEFLKRLSPQDIRLMGLSSGNTQIIYPGERIDIDYMERLARSDIGNGESVIDWALHRYGSSEAVIVDENTIQEKANISAIRETVEPATLSIELERIAKENVREETLFKYIDGLIVEKDFSGNRQLWNSLAATSADQFLKNEQVTEGGVLLQKRLISLAQLSSVSPETFESVHEFVDRAFRSFIERSGVEPKSNEEISGYLERSIDAYIRTHPEIFGKK
jgi:hypothetical protein